MADDAGIACPCIPMKDGMLLYDLGLDTPDDTSRCIRSTDGGLNMPAIATRPCNLKRMLEARHWCKSCDDAVNGPSPCGEVTELEEAGSETGHRSGNEQGEGMFGKIRRKKEVTMEPWEGLRADFRRPYSWMSPSRHPCRK